MRNIDVNSPQFLLEMQKIGEMVFFHVFNLHHIRYHLDNFLQYKR